MAIDDFPQGTFGQLELGIPTQGVIEHCPEDGNDHSSDVDQFQFEVEAGELYGIVVPFDNHFVSVSLRNSSGLWTEFLGSWFDGTPTKTVGNQFLFIAPATGTYTVDVFNSYTNNDRPYTLTFDKHEIPEGVNSRIHATYGQLRKFDIESSGDADTFLLQLEEGFTYRFDVKGLSSGAGTIADPELRLFKDYNVYQFVDWDDDSGEGTDASLVLSLPESNTRNPFVYYATISDGSGGTGSYEFSYTLLDYSDDFAGDASTESLIQFYGAGRVSSVEGEIEIVEDVDWHAIDLEAGRWYQFYLDTNRYEGRPFSTIRDPQGQLVDPDQFINNAYFQATQTGRYYYQVGDHSPDADTTFRSDYSLYVTDDAPPLVSAETAKWIQGDDTVFANSMLFLNGYPAVRVQLISEVDFFVEDRRLAAYQVHNLTAAEFELARFEAATKRGAFDVSFRAIGGGTFSNWSQTTLHSLIAPADVLGIDQVWNSENTQRQTGDVITYRFADALPSYFDGRFAGFSEVNESVKAAIEGILSETMLNGQMGLEAITELTFEMDDSEQADIQIFAADVGGNATGFWPGKFGLGDLVLSNDVFDQAVNVVPGDRNYFELLKGVGAVMGLKPFQAQLTSQESVMGKVSVQAGQPFPETFGIIDRDYLTGLYGRRDPNTSYLNYYLGEDETAFFRSTQVDTYHTSIRVSPETDRAAVLDLRQGASSYLLGDGPQQAYASQYVRVAWGGDGDDTLIGNSQDNELHGSFGADVIIGGAGDDDLNGGGGNDIYRYQTGDGNDVIFDVGKEFDTLEITGKFGLESVQRDLTFRREYHDLVLTLDMYDQPNRSSGEIRIQRYDGGGGINSNGVERLELRNFEGLIGVYDLYSVFAQADGVDRRFVPAITTTERGQTLAALT